MLKILKKVFDAPITSFNLKYGVERALQEKKYEIAPIASSLKRVLSFWTTKEEKFVGIAQALKDLGVTEIKIDYETEEGGLVFIGDIKTEEEMRIIREGEILQLKEQNTKLVGENKDFKEKIERLHEKEKKIIREGEEEILQLKEQNMKLVGENKDHKEKLERLHEEESIREGEEEILQLKELNMKLVGENKEIGRAHV